MSNTLAFKFEDASLTVLGDILNPLFIAKQVCSILGFVRARDAVAQHCDPDDISKVEIETKGGKQLVNCVNESGLYALIFGSKLPKAKQFKKWVTSEVLPAIRKQRAYMSEQLTYEQALKIVEAKHASETATITSEQQYEISSHVMRKSHALFGNRNYSAVYRALKRRFRIPRYTCLLQRDYDNALRFIDSLTKEDFDLPDINEVPASSATSYTVQPPTFIIRMSEQRRSYPVPVEDRYYITDPELQALKSLVYYFDDLFKPQIQWAEREAFRQNLPQASRFYDVWHEPTWFIGCMKKIIARHS